MRRSLRFTGVAAVATLWTSLLVATARGGFDLLGAEPLSYLGSDAGTAGLFSVGLLVSALLLAGFHWFVRDRFLVAPGFSAAMLTGLAGQLVAAVVPIGGDSVVHRVHTISALVLGISLPLLMWRFAAGQPQGRWRRISYALFWVEAAACVVGLYLSARMVAPVAEILPASAFHAWIIIVTIKAARGTQSLGGPPCRDEDGGQRATSDRNSAAISVTSSRPVVTAMTRSQPGWLAARMARNPLISRKTAVAIQPRRLLPSTRA